MFSPHSSSIRSNASYHLEKVSGAHKSRSKIFGKVTRATIILCIKPSAQQAACVFCLHKHFNLHNLEHNSSNQNTMIGFFVAFVSGKKKFLQKSLVFPPKMCKLPLTEIKHIFEEDATMLQISEIVKKTD